jgi:primosomal protein N' (replication factor Y)
MKGPAAAPVVKLRTEYRYQFLLRARDRKLLSGALQRARAFALDNEWPATALVIDVDPMSLM